MFRLSENLCHPEQVKVCDGRRVICDACHTQLFTDVDDYLLSLKPYSSCLAAQIYVQTSKDLNVRCKISVANLEGIMPCEAIVRYDALVQVMRILGMMNSEFLVYKGTTHFDRKSSLNYKIMAGFMKKLERNISVVSGKDYEMDMLGVLRNMTDYLKRMATEFDVNMIDMFLDVYAVYVKRMASFTERRAGSELDMDCPGVAFDAINADAETIRRDLGRFSLQFDLVYVLVYVYLFCESNHNLDLMMNLVLDFISRLCHGRYDAPNEILKKCETSLSHKLKHTRNTGDLSRLSTQMKRPGSCVELLSLDNIRKVKTMQEMVTDKFCEHVWLWPDSSAVVNYAQSQMFPYVLFASGDPQYYGYVMSLSYLSKYLDKKFCTLRKHSLANSKEIIRFVETYILKVRGFETMYWTSDVFQQFVAFDADFLQSVQKFAKTFLSFEKDEGNAAVAALCDASEIEMISDEEM